MSTTVEAAAYDLPYIISINDKVFISDGIFILKSSKSGATTVFGNLDALRSVNCTVVLQLKYNTSLQQWQTSAILEPVTGSSVFYRYGTSTSYSKSTKYVTIDGGTSSGPEAYWKAKSVVTNVAWNTYEKAAVGSYTNDLTQLPQGLTEDAIRDIIDEQLNTMSSSGNTATTIINNTTTQYNLYLAGDIDSATMQQTVTSNIDTLSDLTPSTLLDAMQINNGLTYNQTIQDQLLNTSSDTTQGTLKSFMNTVNSIYDEYINGERNQESATSNIRQIMGYISNRIASGEIKTTADLEAANAVLTTMQAYLDAITGYKDLSQDSSEKSQQSDQAELDYLDELTAETTATVEQIAPSKNFTSGQTGEAQEVLNLIWENEFVKRLLPMCAGFMVVCVVLGIRYKV